VTTPFRRRVLAGIQDRHRLRTSLLIGLSCLFVYNLNGRSITAGDTYPARYLPFAILRNHTLYLDPVANVTAQGKSDTAFWMVPRPGGHVISLYPVVTPLLVAPLYLPAVVYVEALGWTDARVDLVGRAMEKLAASLLAALSVSLLYLLLRRRTRPAVALLLTVAYAFGTTTWVTSSQALWQHGAAQLLIVGALLALTAPCTVRRAIAAGLLIGFVAGNRPPDAILAAALGVYGLWWAGRRRAPLLAVAAALPAALVLLYNVVVSGSFAGGYGLRGNPSFFQHDLWTGIAGVLVSPTKGLLVFSPFLVFLVLAWRYVPTNREERRLTIAMTTGVLLQILLYAKGDWRGGLSWGPRYMTDLLPFLIWMLAPVVEALRGAGRAAFVVAVALAVGIETIGAFWYYDSVEAPLYAADRPGQRQDMRAAFLWRNAPFIASLKLGLAPAELAASVRGSFERVESGGHETTTVTAGQPAFVSGWALARKATPAQVSIWIDGKEHAETGAFFDRSDIRSALNVSSPAGWRIPLDTASLSAGPHRITAFVRAPGTRDDRYLDARSLTVRPRPAGGAGPIVNVEPIAADLSDAAMRAASRIREHQQAPGYWLTQYTSGTSFQDPHSEMNTFLTALVLDVLNPLAANTGLDDTLQRARQHLTSQIEAGGLVRYHGLPNGPAIGTLGCAITPDTDDTALVWRLAPANDRSRLTAALATLDRYRTREGLYRTWLSPRDAYQCLDPGKDPNPADIAIQMHLLLLLADVRPAAAHALCDALRPVVDDDRVWVYYRRAPLVPMLREADLRRAGCALQLPDSRMRTDVAGQQIWVSAVRLLAGKATLQDVPPDPVLIRAILRELARDDFALLRNNPPLFYHNDLTASVSRYYWSEDFGYALWLRLYDAYEQLRDTRGAR